MSVAAAKKTTKKAAKRGRGRPVIITDKHIEDIETALKNGAYIETASAYAGIHKDTFYEWLKRGARALAAVYNEKTGLHNRKKIPETERRFVEFSDAVKKASADSELFDLGIISKAAKDGAWQAAAWRLERKHPERYGRGPMRVKASAKVGDGEYTTNKEQPAPAAKEEIPDEQAAVVLDPRNPPELHVTIDIGGKEINPDELED